MTLALTPSQTVGPFFGPALLREARNVLADGSTPGVAIRIEGRVLDGVGEPVPDAVVEIWQADASGRYAHPLDGGLTTGFTGFGRSGTEDGGRFWFQTVKPGAVAFEGKWQAPHMVVTVASRGMLNHAVTRMYFEDEEAANDADPVLALVPAERRTTLKARRDAPNVYRFDIVLQGESETVFFNV